MLLSCLRTFRSTCAQCQTGERSWPVGNVASTLCAMIAWMSTLPNVVAHQTRSAVRVVTTIWRPSCDLNPHGGVLTNFVGRMIGNLGPRAALYARKCIFWRNNCTRGGGGGSYGIAYWQAAYIEILGIGGFLQLSASIRRRIWRHDDVFTMNLALFLTTKN